MSNAGSMESRVRACEPMDQSDGHGWGEPSLTERSAISGVKRRLWVMLTRGECTGRVDAASLCSHRFTLESYVSAINISWENFSP